MDLEVKVKLVIMSHLSDVQEGICYQNTQVTNNHKINFVKYLLLKFNDTDKLINANQQYQLFLKETSKNLVVSII